jgi:hypothetical protein
MSLLGEVVACRLIRADMDLPYLRKERKKRKERKRFAHIEGLRSWMSVGFSMVTPQCSMFGDLRLKLADGVAPLQYASGVVNTGAISV